MNKWLENFEELPDEIAVVDLETTGSPLDPSKVSTIDSKIVQIGITVCDIKNHTKKVVFDKFINNGDLTEDDKKSWIFRKTDKNPNPLSFDEVITTGKHIRQYWDILQTYLDLPITAFNADFDLSILRFLGFDIPRPLPCLMYSYGEIISPKEKEVPIAIRSFDKCYKTLIEKPLEHGHKASDDSNHESEVLFKMLDKNSYPILHCDLINIFRHDISHQIRFYHHLLDRFLLDKIDETDQRRWEQLLISDVCYLHVDRFSGTFGNEFISNTSDTTKQKIHQMYWEELAKRYNLSIKDLQRMLLKLVNTRKSRQYNELYNEELERIDVNWEKIIIKS